MTEPALAVRELEVRYAGVPAVRDLTFSLEVGEIVGLIGPNGAGKSTTLAAIMGLLRPARGDVRLGGRSIVGQPPERIAHAGVSLVPEGRRIFGDFSVADNLRLGLSAARGSNARAALETVYELFPMLREARRRSAGALSGGQQQQLAIGRALVSQPRILLLDEPSLGLAPTIVDAVFETLARVRERGVTILLVEQRAQRTVAFADRTHVLGNGELRMTLAPEQADDTDLMIAAYLG